MSEYKISVSTKSLIVVAEREEPPSARKEIRLAWWPMHLLTAVTVFLVAFYTPVGLLGALCMGVSIETMAIWFIMILAISALPRRGERVE